ncbi:hypothetical protein SHI21_17775 [Bacteriovorax sp. PP10]|uniref:Uncharacterized protein n=1 Tax=Bacteriovorax antarcticus TaxID=3088717 RepID=A0ABU5VYF7_9BACT|nr:hypothetical protein [Bacteriovorax sp. PP10]MEA9358087.1 hypothetical protein [Bacteriovorax sp. PP10]
MAKKKKGADNNDMTRIEDLSEFLHQEDSDLDSRFDTFSSPPKDLTSTGVDVNALDESSEALPDLPSEDTFQNTDEEEISFEPSSLDEVTFESSDSEEVSYDKTSFGENPFGSTDESEPLEELAEVSFGEVTEESMLEDSLDDHQDHSNDVLDDDMDVGYDNRASTASEPIYTNTSEKFEDVKSFAQNFSYGKVSLGGGNPPYTIIARNIKYQDDAENILDILREFGIINDQNEKDTQKAMEFGALIIPQISEYTAIIIAHKLRRFDLDLQVGLSDEVHPSKSGEGNPRGLLKKDSLKQNRSESLKLTDLNTSIKDIIISTTAAIPGYFVESYIGVQTTFAVVEEAELEKLQYVEKSQREHSELFDFNNNSEISTEKVFQDYHNSFALLYEDLTAQLKQKAFAQHANALLGLTFQLSPLQFERSHARVNAYQITCSATLAIVGRENS